MSALHKDEERSCQSKGPKGDVGTPQMRCAARRVFDNLAPDPWMFDLLGRWSPQSLLPGPEEFLLKALDLIGFLRWSVSFGIPYPTPNSRVCPPADAQLQPTKRDGSQNGFGLSVGFPLKT